MAHRARTLWLRVGRGRTLGATAILGDERGVWLVRHTYMRGWFLPGGGVKRAETFHDAVRREVLEELGLTIVGPVRLLGAYGDGRNRHMVTFSAGAWTGEARAASAEIAEVRLVDPRATPEGTSRGTTRRIAEWLGDREPDGRW